MPNLTLVILAAGLGSRYGSEKQIDAFGPNNESIMDYSIYDALSSGFNKIVIVIKESMLTVLEQKYIKHLKLNVFFVIQSNSIEYNSTSISREKPWGTAHALWTAREFLNDPFLVINADDFYGRNSFLMAVNFLANHEQSCNIAFKVSHTLSEFGAVNRAEIIADHSILIETIERTNIVQECSNILYLNENNERINLNENTLVSMNMWGIQPNIVPYFLADLEKFAQTFSDNSQIEWQLPTLLNKIIKENKTKIYVLESTEKWIGVTYLADKKFAKQYLKDIHSKKQYKTDLWNSF